MPLPTLENWEAARDGLHQVALVVSAVRVAGLAALPNDLHFSTPLRAAGISTAELNFGGELCFDFADLRLVYRRDGAAVFALEVNGHTQTSLMAALLRAFAAAGVTIAPAMKRITGTSRLHIEPRLAADYWTVVDAVYTALARFRAKLSGFMTPLVIWPHHFDMAFLWFATPATREHSDPHLAVGFAPFSAGLERPYFYAYAWSAAGGYVQVPLAAPARAIDQPYVGLYAEYDRLRSAADFNAAVEQMFRAYHRRAAPALK